MLFCNLYVYISDSNGTVNECFIKSKCEEVTVQVM